MRLIVGADAIVFPLTGIGRYAFELGRHLSAHSDIDQLSFFQMGRWVSWGELVSADSEFCSFSAENKMTQMAALRAFLSRSRLAVGVYERLMPAIAGWRLRPHRGSVFHAPNYFIPPHLGPAVATIHDLSHIWYPSFHPEARVSLLRRALPKSLDRANFLITDSLHVKDEIIEYFNWPADRIAAISLGVDSKYAPRENQLLEIDLERFGLTPGRYVLFVGTVEPRKNIDTVLSAYERIPLGVRREFPLVVAGSTGWNSESTHRRLGKFAAEGWVKYLDFCPQSLLPSLYAGARLFVYPSIYEGFGLPPLEALASGVPVLCSNASSLPEVVGESARLLEPMDIDAWVHGISAGLSDNEWYRAAKVVGPEHAKQFTWEKCVAKTVKAYESAVCFAE
jgi:glycosyltransferase involved in cell wall biosynthesis